VNTSSGYFESLSQSARAAEVPHEVSVHEIDAPTGLAPGSLAFSANVVAGSGHLDRGTGRLIILDDPEEPVAWGGRTRAIVFAQSPLEVDLGRDEMYSAATWAMLLDELRDASASHTHSAGTVTRVVSTGFGELESQGRGTQIEVRASWSPTSWDVRPHVEAWARFVARLAGFPPQPEGVTNITAR
jgi:hypothetical protein